MASPGAQVGIGPAAAISVQHGVRHYRLVDKISSNIDNKKHSIGIFLDLSKAFDTIDHQILLRKLQCYGIDESIYGQKTPNPKKIDTKGFLMDFGSFDHA